MSHDAYGSGGFADCALTLSALRFGLCTRKEGCQRGLMVSYSIALTLRLSGVQPGVWGRAHVYVCLRLSGWGRQDGGTK